MKYEPTEVISCHGKPGYDKKTAVTARNKRYKEDKIKLRIYECPECGKWHLTKNL